MKKVLNLGGSPRLRETLPMLLRGYYEVVQKEAKPPDPSCVAEIRPAVVTLDPYDEHGNPRMDLVDALLRIDSSPPLIAISEHVKPAHVVEAIRRGCYSYFDARVGLAEIRQGIDEACSRSFVFEKPLAGDALAAVESVVGVSRCIARVRSQAVSFAKHSHPVLIEGENGTGKDLLANVIHAASDRADGPFVAINCGAIPEQLFESELFGASRGAYTDAVDRVGILERSHGGSLFLDEVDSLSLSCQAKLLRVLEDMRVRRLGSGECVRVDARIIAASNADLFAAIEAGRFRADLWYRLNTLRLRLPPLRERGEDIAILARRFAAECGVPGGELSYAAIAKLERHPWRGNVRELRSVVYRASVYSDKKPIEAHDIEFNCYEGPAPIAAAR
jgi:DNA-binding NtrC family response regulator